MLIHRVHAFRDFPISRVYAKVDVTWISRM